ncbi:MAG: hypothetical protein SCALA702_20510 [Melioribacteraceae bacterium]|nr:MAG: hypothetical protein SCALA702_20510 [Melioribacteraceae bacterium]
MKTVRYTTFAMIAFMVKKGNSMVLKLNLDIRRKQWLKTLWANSDSCLLPFKPDRSFLSQIREILI